MATSSFNFVDRAFWQDVLNAPFHGWTDPYSLVNGGFGVRSADGRLMASVQVANVFDRDRQQPHASVTSLNGRSPLRSGIGSSSRPRQRCQIDGQMRSCPSCGGELSAEAWPGGLCPRCLSASGRLRKTHTSDAIHPIVRRHPHVWHDLRAVCHHASCSGRAAWRRCMHAYEAELDRDVALNMRSREDGVSSHLVEGAAARAIVIRGHLSVSPSPSL